jgi:hypothetical protein
MHARVCAFHEHMLVWHQRHLRSWFYLITTQNHYSRLYTCIYIYIYNDDINCFQLSTYTYIRMYVSIFIHTHTHTHTRCHIYLISCYIHRHAFFLSLSCWSLSTYVCMHVYIYTYIHMMRHLLDILLHTQTTLVLLVFALILKTNIK